MRFIAMVTNSTFTVAQGRGWIDTFLFVGVCAFHNRNSSALRLYNTPTHYRRLTLEEIAQLVDDSLPEPRIWSSRDTRTLETA